MPKLGFRTPSLKKRIAARTSVKRMIRSKLRVPRGMGVITNPKKAVYNRIYNRTTKDCFSLVLLAITIFAIVVVAVLQVV